MRTGGQGWQKYLQSVKNPQKIKINFQGLYEVKERIGEHI